MFFYNLSTFAYFSAATQGLAAKQLVIMLAHYFNIHINSMVWLCDSYSQWSVSLFSNKDYHITATKFEIC